MYEELKGKTLLFLGANYLMCEPIELAKSMGIKTIAVDYYEDSPAKKVADKAFLISNRDIDAIVALCRKEHVDGIFTSFTDYVLSSAQKICRILQLPFYGSEEQIRLSLDKQYFKTQCRKFGVAVPNDYYEEIQKKGLDGCCIEFPVVAKPADSCGGRGVTICHNKTQLAAAIDCAKAESPNGSVLVEEYLDGMEVSATYTMKNGEISLSSMKDKWPSLGRDNITGQAVCAVSPSQYLSQFKTVIHPPLVRMLKSLHAKDGVFFIQGRATGKGLKMFEMGYRIGGLCDYRDISSENGIHYLKMLLAHSLTGEMGGYDLSMDNPDFKDYVCAYSLFAHGGTVGSLIGLERIKAYPKMIHAEWRYDTGCVIKEDNTQNQRVFCCTFRADTVDELKKTILAIQKDTQVLDTEGKSMLCVPFDVSRLDDYQKNNKREVF